MQNVRIVAATRPVAEEIKLLSSEELLAYIARVSNPANQHANAPARSLIRYLFTNQHWSPFEMLHLVLEVETTRDIGRQILRHRSFSFQEFSQRYAEVVNFCEAREARLQDKKNRQNSIEIDDSELEQAWRDRQELVMQTAQSQYLWALENGIAKEQARVVLPEGLAMSKLYMAGSLRSWIHYCLLRMGNGTQKEHRDIAVKAWSLVVEELPALESLHGILAFNHDTQQIERQ